MSRFFVGQRVRIVGKVWLGEGPSPNGLEGRVVRIGGVGARTGAFYDYTVDAGNWYSVQATDLEPIQPEGMQPVDWNECLWKPEHIEDRRHA